MCLYMFDVGLTEADLCQLPASLRCAAAVFLARKLLLPCDCPGVCSVHGCIPDTSVDSAEGSLLRGHSVWSDRLACLTGHHEDHRLQQTALVYAGALTKLKQQLGLSPEASTPIGSSRLSAGTASEVIVSCLVVTKK